MELRMSRKFHTTHCGSHFRGKMHEFLALQDDHSPTRSTIPEAIGYVTTGGFVLSGPQF